MQLVCPRCGDPISGEDIDLPRGIGVCRPCGEIIPIPTVPATWSTRAEPSPVALYRPETFRFVEQGGDAQNESYEATLVPNRMAALPALFFTLFWDGFMIFWYAIAVVGRIWPMAAFGLLHLGVAFYLTHKVLVGMFNTRRFHIGGGRVRYTNGPIPAGGQLDAPLTDVDAFAVTTKISSSQRTTTTSYVLVANMAGGSGKKLSCVLEDAASAEFAVQRLNEVLREAKTRGPHLPYRS